MSHRYFITGTDTEVGKTFVSVALLQRAGALGYTTAALKPVAAGAEASNGSLRNDDAVALMEAVSPPVAYRAINPFCFREAIAPHIAAANENCHLDVAAIVAASQPFLTGRADFAVVEGAGGWRVPLNDGETFADLARTLALPVILVVGMRLGCINHALLTAEAVERDGLRLAGWVANRPGPEMMARYRENLATLATLIKAPLLGEMPYLRPGDQPRAADFVRLPDHLDETGSAGKLSVFQSADRV